VEEQGRAAARMLLATLDGSTAHSNEHLLLPVSLVERRSTAAPPTALPSALLRDR